MAFRKSNFYFLVLNSSDQVNCFPLLESMIWLCTKN